MNTPLEEHVMSGGHLEEAWEAAMAKKHPHGCGPIQEYLDEFANQSHDYFLDAARAEHVDLLAAIKQGAESIEGMMRLWQKIGGDTGNFYYEQAEAALSRMAAILEGGK